MQQHTKTVDSKGRLTLGSSFAGRLVIINDADPNRLVITPAVPIPAHEAWLYQNAEALDRVRRGAQEARAGQLSATPPDLAADAVLADAIDD